MSNDSAIEPEKVLVNVINIGFKIRDLVFEGGTVATLPKQPCNQDSSTERSPDLPGCALAT